MPPSEILGVEGCQQEPGGVWCPPHATFLALTLPMLFPLACLFRFNVLSLVYLLFLLLLPWFPGPSQGSAQGKWLSLGCNVWEGG